MKKSVLFYELVSDIERNRRLINSIDTTQYCFKIRFNMILFDDYMCDSIEYVLEKIKKIDVIILKYYYNQNIGDSTNIVKILRILNEVDKIKIVSKHNLANYCYELSSSIETVLRNISTKQLIFDGNIILDDRFAQIINSNQNIKNVCVTVHPYQLVCHNVVVSKINRIVIINNSNNPKPYTKDIMTYFFNYAPKIVDIIIRCRLSNDIIEKIVEFVTSKHKFNNLCFQYSGLTCENIQFICNSLTESNITFITLRSDYISDDSCDFITNMIKNSRSIEYVEIGKIGNVDNLIKIVESLTNTKIKTFIADTYFPFEHSITQKHSEIVDILTENYFLTKISINISKWLVDFEKDINSIIERNVKLSHQRRFINTKKAV